MSGTPRVATCDYFLTTTGFVSEQATRMPSIQFVLTAPVSCIPAVCSEGVTSILGEALKEVDSASGGAVADILAAGGFEGKQVGGAVW